MAAEVKPTLDVTVENHGSIFLFHLHTEAARDWVHDNVPEGAFWAGTLACEANYARDLAAGMMSDGLDLE